MMGIDGMKSGFSFLSWQYLIFFNVKHI